MTTLTTEELATITLKSGSHAKREEGVCAMEAVAWLAGEPHSDAPACTSPVIASFLRRWNDILPTDAERNRLLRPLLPLMVDTKANGVTELRRSYMALDWLVRVHTVAWLRLAGLYDYAEALSGLDEITGPATMEKALPAFHTARVAAWAAWVAGDAAWAAWAARDAARVAAWAAWAAAWAAARAAARVAAWAAWAAARAAAGVAAWAAWDAAWGDAWVTWGAARVAARAAREALLPTVAELQASAQDLVRRMAATGG